MEFTKAHGTGNDFVVITDLHDELELSDALVRAICDRHRGVGADGVLRLGAPTDGGDVFMDHRNADGSRPEMCGNGVRVVAKHVVDRGLVTPDADGGITIATRAGFRTVRVHRDAAGTVGQVAVDMGPPVWHPPDVPFEVDGADGDAVTHDVAVEGVTVELAAVSMGNPHGVLVVDDVGEAPVATLGPQLETHRRFPAKANIGFAQVVARDTIRLRVWERGVGETMACGTGACAAVVALQRQGLVDAEVAVHLPGGTLTITYAADIASAGVTMTGPAVEVAHGSLDEAWLTAARRGDLEVGAP
jgi:diaminopimelate epimerase